MKGSIKFTIRQKKLCVFPVTCPKILGSVGRKKNLLFFLFFTGTNVFFLKEVMAKLFFHLILLLLHPNNSNDSTNR